MTQHLTRAKRALPRSPRQGGLRGKFLTLWLVLVAALLTVLVVFDAGSTAFADDGEITGLTLARANPGELVISWDAASPTPYDYRVTWAKSDEKFKTWTDPEGNAFPTGNWHTVEGLEEREEYKVRVRARYLNPDGDLHSSGPWSLTARTTVAGQPVSTPTPEPTSTAETRTVNEQVPPRKGTKTPPRYDNLDYSLNELASQYESEDSPTRGIRTPQAGDVEESPAVVVYVDPAGLREVFRFLQTNGARVREPDDGDEYLVANVPVSMLPRLSRQRGVEYVKVDELIRATGGPGATAHGVPPWDTAGYDGTGVKIGVLDLGFQGYSSLIGTGLPQPEAVRCWTTDVNVQHNTLVECETVSGMENHGTAVTEMLYDVAPGATYYLARVGRTADIVEAVEWLNDHEVDVMNFSGATPWDGPGDGTSPYAHSPLNAVDKAVMNGAFFSATAGNEGGDSWYGKLHDADGDNVLEFSSGDECNSVTLE